MLSGTEQEHWQALPAAVVVARLRAGLSTRYGPKGAQLDNIDTPKAILIGAAILGLAIYAGGHPRYEIVRANDGAAFVLDRNTGSVRACGVSGCVAIKD